jgi:hypothetical protein
MTDSKFKILPAVIMKDKKVQLNHNQSVLKKAQMKIKKNKTQTKTINNLQIILLKQCSR